MKKKIHKNYVLIPNIKMSKKLDRKKKNDSDNEEKEVKKTHKKKSEKNVDNEEIVEKKKKSKKEDNEKKKSKKKDSEEEEINEKVNEDSTEKKEKKSKKKEKEEEQKLTDESQNESKVQNNLVMEDLLPKERKNNESLDSLKDQYLPETSFEELDNKKIKDVSTNELILKLAFKAKQTQNPVLYGKCVVLLNLLNNEKYYSKNFNRQRNYPPKKSAQEFSKFQNKTQEFTKYPQKYNSKGFRNDESRNYQKNKDIKINYNNSLETLDSKPIEFKPDLYNGL